MFACIGNVKLEQAETAPDGSGSFKLSHMISKEGEEVALKGTIAVGPSVGVKEWLKQLEDQMRNTLAHLLERAVEERASDFAAWVESFPTQVIIIAVQVWWSSGVEAKLIGKGPADLSTCTSDLNAKLLTSVQRVLSDVNPQVNYTIDTLESTFKKWVV